MTLLEVKAVAKHFGAVQVLNGVDLTIEAGTVTGLVGDNGAGKSTLMKTITGLYGTDGGEIRFDGKPMTGLNPGQRRALGIEMIYQDLALARQQDVAANIFLGREPVKWAFGILPGFVDKAKMDADARKMIDRLGARIPSIHRPVGMFSGGQQQTVAIARALTFNPKLVIMDEPTAALAVREVESVLKLIRQMRDEGIAVILISHRLNDVFEVTDRIVVLRQGRIEADLQTGKTQMREVVGYIVGAH
ncbi:MAG: sugar ABC transporter ATP-binding protein [Rhizobiales bacterium]|nr:sugar ABC transporter ATP-binding protein [Hyphomicrobiales bacterium]